MNLTPAERASLTQWAEWRDLQIDYFNICAYQHFTKLEDLDVVKVTLALEELSTRRAAFLAQWTAQQGGTHAQHNGHAAGGSDASGNAAASSGDAGEEAGASRGDAERGGVDTQGTDPALDGRV